MQIHADFSARVVLLPGQQQFVPSPLPGVSRVMLDRAGEEVARATSLVRYEPGSGFSAHRHDGGEEILVLEGVFSDEHGHYTGAEGALIYVKTGHLGANLLGDQFIQMPL